MDKEITIGEKYRPAMAITDAAAAVVYFEQCVAHSMLFGHDRAEAERIERMNLGYFAGYYDSETRERVERLFQCAHPMFGSIADRGSPTTEQALGAGLDAAKAVR